MIVNGRTAGSGTRDYFGVAMIDPNTRRPEYKLSTEYNRTDNKSDGIRAEHLTTVVYHIISIMQIQQIQFQSKIKVKSNTPRR